MNIFLRIQKIYVELFYETTASGNKFKSSGKVSNKILNINNFHGGSLNT